MRKTDAETAHDEWTLIRGARQLLTLRGASGPRRGIAMTDLNVVSDGAVLIRNGLIEDVGSTRRVENLAPARLAREIDARGKVIMPAFADPDVALTSPEAGAHVAETDIRRMSRRRLDNQAMATVADLARFGVLTIGAPTRYALDLQSAIKALRVNLALQSKPLRIRSVFSPPHRISQTWMPAIARKKLASVAEISATESCPGDAQALAAAAAASGYSIRFRVSGQYDPEVLELAHSAGSVALLGPIAENSAVSRGLSDAGCVQVALVAQMLAGECTSARGAVDFGTPVALASGYGNNGTASLNPQFLLYMACRHLGLSIEEAIVATTYNAVCSLRLSHVTGSLEPGKSADLVVMDLDDYNELGRRAGHHDAHLVIRAGRIVYRRSNLKLE